MIYLILVNLTLLLCYALYSTFFKKLTFFQLNRIYLLGAIVVSLLIPIGLFIEIPRTAMMEGRIPSVDLNMLFEEEMLFGKGKATTISIYNLLQRIYWSGCFFALAWLCIRCIRVVAIIRKGSSSFSFAFFKKIVLSEKVRDNYIIEDHESIHVTQGHTYDIVFIEIVRVFNWFNPVLHYYLKELKFQHECIADSQCSLDRVAYAELLVSQAMQVEHAHFLHEFSKKSFLKNRITMLFKDRSHKKYKFLYFSIIPVLGLTTLSTLVFNSANAKNIVRDIEDKVESTTNYSERQRDTIGRDAQATDDENKIFLEVQVNPEPVGGLTKFRKWLGDNYEYPQGAIDAAVKGQIVVSFIVEADGALSNLKIINDLGHGTGEAVLDVLRKSPNWRPAIQNGRKVRVAFTLPVTLNLQQETKK